MSAKAKLTLGYCPEGNGDSIAPFNRVFANKQNVHEMGFKGVDAVVFWGGADIHPSYYNEGKNVHSQAGNAPSRRDIFEWKAMQYCKLHNIPMIGVCRGAQLMTAFVGGKLIQHVNGHHQPHMITTEDGEFFTSTSCHHQMMYPFDVEHHMLAWSSTKESSLYLNGTNTDILAMNSHLEPEIVYYPQIAGLAIQGHPEWAVTSTFSDYCNSMITDLILNRETEGA